MTTAVVPSRAIHAETHEVPAPTFSPAASVFPHVYMRPNTGNGGAVPAQGTLCTSPDIWPAGTAPVPSFQTALATPQSYATNPPDQITLHEDNYIYVRGYNGAQSTQSVNVSLYYSPSGVIQWPSQWQNNVIKTDQGNSSANISNLAPGTVGVADQTFLWSNVQPPPSGSDHYCLISQFNDANNSNPFPAIYTQLDLAALITNNLGWGWRNVQLVSAGAQPTFSFALSLAIPQNVTPGSNTYFVYVNPTGFNGWNVSFQCSQSDSKGNPIRLDKTQITSSGQLLGTTCYLEPGFSAMVTVYMYQGSQPAAQGATVPLAASYQTSQGWETEEAFRRNLIDWHFMHRFQQTFGGIPINGWIPMGANTAQNSPSPSLFRAKKTRSNN